jgi:hypothetical protein
VFVELGFGAHFPPKGASNLEWGTLKDPGMALAGFQCTSISGLDVVQGSYWRCNPMLFVGGTCDRPQIQRKCT